MDGTRTGMGRRVLNVLLALVLVVGLMPAIAAAPAQQAQAVSVYTGSMSALNEDGGDAAPNTSYSIDGDAEFGYFVDYVNSGKDTRGVSFTVTSTNATYAVTSVIAPATVASDTTTSSPYVSLGDGFEGTFDGGGNTFDLSIATSTGATGMFGYVAPTGTVENLTATGSVTVSGTCDAIGGVVGYNSGIVDDVTSSVDVTAASGMNVGGVVGYNDNYYMAGAIGTVRNSESVTASASGTVQGSVSGKSKVGGIAGANSGVIASCYNEVSVTATNSSKTGAGGITGRNGNNNTAVEAGVVRDCYNQGAVSTSNGRWAGGINGFQNGISSTTNCYNVGTLTAYRDKGHVCGKNEGAVTNCYGLDSVSTDSSDGVTLRTDDQMRNSLAGLLGSAYNAQTLGQYPTLKQTADCVADPVTTGHGSTAPVETSGVILGGQTGYATLSAAIAAAETATDHTIYVAGQVTLTAADSRTAGTQVTIKRSASYTGAMFVLDGATVTLDYVTFDGNGVTGSNVVRANSGALTLGSHVTFQNVDSNAAGGAVHVQGATVCSSANYTNCSARNGGAVSVSSGSCVVYGGNFSECSATHDGGAVYITGGTMTLDPLTSTSISGTIYLGSGCCIHGGDGLGNVSGAVTVATEDHAIGTPVADCVESDFSNLFVYRNNEYALEYDEENEEVTVGFANSSSSNSGMSLMGMKEATHTESFSIPAGTDIEGVQTISGGTEEDPIVVTIEGDINYSGSVELFLVSDGSYVKFVGKNEATITSTFSNGLTRMLLMTGKGHTTINDLTFDASNVVSKVIEHYTGSTQKLTLENVNISGFKSTSNNTPISVRDAIVEMTNVSLTGCQVDGTGTPAARAVRSFRAEVYIYSGSIVGSGAAPYDVRCTTSGTATANPDVTHPGSVYVYPTGNVTLGKTTAGNVAVAPQEGYEISSYKLVNTDGTVVTDIPTAETSLGTGFTSLDVEASTAPTGPSVELSASSASVVKGDELTVDVTMTGGLASAQGTLTYDSTKLQLEGITSTMPEFVQDGDGFSFMGNEAALDGTVVATATFRARDGADSTEVGLTGVTYCVSGDIADYALDDPEALDVAVLYPYTLGDANDNGKVNVVDAQVVLDMANGKWGEGYADLLEALAARTPATVWNCSTASAAADYNKDGVVDATDARAIQSSLFA